MPHSVTYNSIILKSYDIGEADRFLILLTRERGRLSAKAKAVRKLTSKLGGTLLPFNHVTVGLHEGKAGFIVTSAQAQPGFGYPGRKSTESFLVAEQGIELLLTLLHDDEPVPEIFDATLDFLSSCSSTDVLCPTSEVLAFKLTLLRSLGLLPESKDLPGSNEALESLCSEIITEHATRAQKAQKIISAMM